MTYSLKITVENVRCQLFCENIYKYIYLLHWFLTPLFKGACSTF